MERKLPGVFLVSIICTTLLQAQTVWNGPTMVFSKAASANPALAANQDRITSATWITRGNTQGIYNAKTETVYTHNASPANTEWATGSLSNFASLTYQPWEVWAGGSGNVPSIVGRSAVLHLISENIYIGITFLSWAQGSGGGGAFSYQRTTAPAPTPVTLISFTAVKKNNMVQLHWKTATEENTSSFTIERSGDGQRFDALGTIAASGNSSSERSYSFADPKPLAANFYRLRTNDQDGSFRYSHVVAFRLKKNSSLDVFPIPASGVLHVQLNAAEQTILQVLDVGGRTIQSIRLSPGDNAFTLPIGHLKAGMYWLRAGAESKVFIRN